MTHFTDEDLTAYLDSAADPTMAQKLETALATDPDLAARLADLDVPMGDLKAALDPMIAAAPVIAVPEVSFNTLKKRHSRSMAGLAAALVAGIAFGALVLKPAPQQTAQQDWMDYVAAYQALYVEDTLTAVVQTDAQSAAQLQRVSAQLGRPLDRATDIPGFAYKRAQVLGFNGKPLIQMAYLTDTGVPMALCIIRSDEGETLETMRLEGLEAASWSDGDFAYLLIGGEDSAQIAAAATHLQAQL